MVLDRTYACHRLNAPFCDVLSFLIHESVMREIQENKASGRELEALRKAWRYILPYVHRAPLALCPRAACILVFLVAFPPLCNTGCSCQLTITSRLRVKRRVSIQSLLIHVHSATDVTLTQEKPPLGTCGPDKNPPPLDDSPFQL